MNMRIRARWSIPIALTVMTTMAPMMAGGAEDEPVWEQIDASAPFVDARGVPRAPSCSGGPVWTETPQGRTLVPAETDFSFFIRAGDPERLMIIWDGGGACWDWSTCIGSTLFGRYIYRPSVADTPDRLAGYGGLLDDLNPENPVGDFTRVFIPYCTADLFFGGRDTGYAGPGGGEWLIHHRGHDNVLAVLRYLANEYPPLVGRTPAEILLVGVSAGGYGALYSYPAVAETFPATTKVSVFVDSANGVISPDFHARALTPEGSWGVWENLAPELEAAFSAGAQGLVPGMFRDLGWSYPQTRFGQYTSAFDAVQVFYYNITRHSERPDLWVEPTQIWMAGSEWSREAENAMALTALTTPNYRFYLARGMDHRIAGDESFYIESSADGVRFTDWFTDMLEQPWPLEGNWRNVSCMPDCFPEI
jgi:hypothetical protein